MLFMVDFRKYAKRLQDALGKEYSAGRNSVDSIDEDQWLKVVVGELNKMSFECAKELEPEIGRLQGKAGYPDGQPPEVAPPSRILALHLILSYWLGWVMTEKHGDGKPVFSWDRIQEAYMAGRELSEHNETP
jgi:hypothetical protein